MEEKTNKIVSRKTKNCFSRIVAILSIVALITVCFSNIISVPAEATNTNNPLDSEYAILKWLGGNGCEIGKYNSLITTDIDNDGNQEIIFGNKEGYIYVMECSQGNYREEWHIQIGYNAYGLAVGDVDGDNVKEIIAGTYDGYLYIIDTITHDIRWKSDKLGWMLYGIAVDDVDNDGITEIIVGTYRNGIYAINGITHNIEWHSSEVGTEVFGITVSDVDNDGIKEIIAGSHNWEDNYLRGHIYVFNGINKTLEWKSESLLPCLYNIIVEDIDYDGTKEIITASADSRIAPSPGDGYIYIFDGITHNIEWEKGPFGYRTSLYGLEVGDIDNDGSKEIIAGNSDGYIYIFDAVTHEQKQKNKYVDEWVYGLCMGDTDNDNKSDIILGTKGHVMVFDPVTHEKKWQDNMPGSGIYAVSVGDIDNDGIREIVACDHEKEMYVYNAVNYSLKWKMDLGEWAYYSQIADIDNDGVNEIVLTTSEHHILVIDGIKHTIIGQLNFTDIDFIKVADVQKDGIMEVIVTHEDNVSIINPMTMQVEKEFKARNWMYTLDVADVDNDGNNELIIGAWDGYISIYDMNYTLKYETKLEYLDINALVVGDPDNDGMNEIVVGGMDCRSWYASRVMVLDGQDCTVEWISEPIYTVRYDWDTITGLSVSDVDMDGINEIIVSDKHMVYVFNGSSHEEEWRSDELSGWPSTGDLNISCLDIDEDYQNEIVLGSRGYVYVFGFGVVGIDLVALDRDITFSDPTPLQDQTITISTPIYNKGRDPTQDNITVQFFADSTLINEQDIPPISGNSKQDVSIDWKATAGHHIIRVVVDPNNKLEEFNDGNNEAIKQIVVNIPPTADAGLEQCVKVDTQASFFGAGTDPDGNIAKYEWDFDGDSIFDWQSTTTGTAVYTYTNVGTYDAVLRVVDNEGATATSVCRIYVVNVTGLPPVAVPGINQTVAFINSKGLVTMNGSDSYDPDGGSIMSYDWNWRDLTPHSIGEVVMHNYTDRGLYEIVLTVTDESGLTGNDVTYVKVSYPPRAYAGRDKEERVNLSVSFDDCSGYDPDGSITKYKWDFGDGTIWSSTATPKTTHTYSASAVYTATLTITNSDGLEINAPSLTASDTCVVTIVDNFLPVADAGPNREIRYNRTIQFDGSGSYDRDGHIIEYYWTFGDGNSVYGINPTHIYEKSGTYTVTLTVTDNDGGTDEDTCIVTVTGNEKPVANAGSDRIVYVNDEITFDGSASYDPDGYIISYEWDFGDGTSASDVQTKHSYELAGVMYHVTLTVTDNDGSTGSDTCVVTVISNMGPEVSMRASLYPYYQVTLRDKPVTFYASGSDSDGYIEKYKWDFGDGTPTAWEYTSGNPSSISKEITHSFAGSKDQNIEYTITFTVVDDEGGEAKATCWVLVLKNRLPLVYAGEDKAKYVNEGINSSWNKTVNFMFFALDIDGNLTKVDVDFGDGSLQSFDVAEVVNLSEDQVQALLDKLNTTMPPELPFESMIRESQWLVRESLKYFFAACLGYAVGLVVGYAPWYVQLSWELIGDVDSLRSSKNLIDEAYASGQRCNLQKTMYSMQYWTEVRWGLREPDYLLDETEILKRIKVFMVNHTYPDIGEYDVEVKAYDNDNEYDNDSFRLTLYNNIPPFAETNDASGRINENITLTGLGRDFENNITRFEWDFGDGTYENITLPDKRINSSEHQYFPDMDYTVYNLSCAVNHTYEEGGIYTVTLRVVDEKGLNYTTTSNVKVYPIADAGKDKITKVNDTVTFSGMGQTLNAEIEEYRWNFDLPLDIHPGWDRTKRNTGRAVRDGTSSSVITGWFNTTWEYESIYTYTAKFEIEDTRHSVANDICTVIVNPNQPPVANAGSDKLVKFGDTVYFDGSKSYDPDGYIINYTWAFGDGNTYTETETNALDGIFDGRTTHVYTTSGVYTATLTVTDEDGATNTGTCKVTVIDNWPPVANAGTDQSTYINWMVQFNGSKSYDSDGDIVNYTWDFGDCYDQTPGYGVAPTRVYTHPGTYTVTLTVIDNNNSKDTDICVVRVYNNFPPIVDPGANQVRPYGLPVYFYATAKDPDDRIIKMAWDYNGDGIYDDNETVTDGYGIITWNTMYVYPLPPEAYLQNVIVKCNATLTVWDARGANTSSVCVIEMRSDIEKPSITNLTLPETEFLYTDGFVNFTFDVSDDADPSPRAIVYLDGEIYDKTYLDFSVLSVGKHTLTVEAIDWVGKKSYSSITFTIIDSIPPTVNIVSPEHREYLYVEGLINISYDVYDEKDPMPNITVLLDGNIFTDEVIDFMVLSPGNHTLVVKAMDKSGNIAEKTVTFTLIKKETFFDIYDVCVQYSDTVTLSALLRESTGPVADKIISFYINDIYIGNTSTNLSGIANLSFTCNLLPSIYIFSVVFEGDNYYLPSNNSANLTVLKEDTVLTVNDATVQYSDTVVFSASLTEPDKSLRDRNVSFYVDAVFVGMGLSDVSGNAQISYNCYLKPGSYNITVVFSGDEYYLGSNGSAVLTVLKEDTVITYTGDLMGQYSDNVTLSAVLADEDSGVGISNETVIFTLGNQIVSAITDSYGNATATLTLTQIPDIYNVSVTFLEDDYYLGSSDDKTFTIKKEDTAITAYDLLVTDPVNDTLMVLLYEDGGPVIGRNIDFYVNGTYVGSGIINSTGVAVRSVPFLYLFGNFTWTVEFTGDDYYLPSNDTAWVNTTHEAKIQAIIIQIDKLIEDIDNSTINQGIKNSLTSKLENARMKITQENFNAANNIMEAFQNELDAQRGKKISEEQYQKWYLQSENIRYALQWMMSH